VVLANLGSEPKTSVGSRVHLVGAFISFEKNFYQLPFTPPFLVRRFGPSPDPLRLIALGGRLVVVAGDPDPRHHL
jgi:hypothetical protein